MSIKQNGGVFGRNPTFNDVTIEGVLTFDGDIDINSDLKIDGNLEVTGNATVSGDYLSVTAGTNNLRLGYTAGNSIIAGGNYNVMLGDFAGTAVTDGDYNTLVGKSAGATISTGSGNTIIGGLAGNAISTASNNTAAGKYALSGTSTGASNVAMGMQALYTNISGSLNTGVGYQSLVNATASNNTAYGAFSGDSVSSGTKNLLLGYGACDTISTGSNNTIIGDYAGTAALANTVVICSGTTPRMIIDSAGNASIQDGNLVIGTSGKGIDFSATAGTGTSELLDDYEEGNWTPIDSSGASLTFSTAIGTYVKVGKLVTLSYSVTYPSTADTTDMKIGGLPFTPDVSYQYAGSQSYTTSSAAAASTVTNNSAYILYRTEGTSATINNDQLSSAVLRGSFTYEV